jgi:hypothetical protein
MDILQSEISIFIFIFDVMKTHEKLWKTVVKKVQIKINILLAKKKHQKRLGIFLFSFKAIKAHQTQTVPRLVLLLLK